MECSVLRLSIATSYMYIRSVHPLVLSFCLCATVFRQISLLKCIQDVQSYLGSC